MATYEYKCAKCDKIFQVVRPMTETGPEKCAQCQTVMSKQYGIGAVTFKGNGWGRD